MHLLAVDLGASNGRLMAGGYDGQKITLRQIHTFPNGANNVHGHLYWDVLRLFEEIKVGIGKAMDDVKGEVAGIGLDTWGVDYALLDPGDRLMGWPHHYRDPRTDDLLGEICEVVSREEIYRQTGIQFMQINTLVQLYADLRLRPWIIQNAGSLLFMPDLFNFFLTGEKYNEYTIASTSQLFNPLREDWADPLMDALGFPRPMMRNLIYPGEEIGRVTGEIAGECGLDGELPVMSVGSHDTASAVFATPMEDPHRSIYISSGTWSLLGMELDEPLINSHSLRENFTNECGVGRKIRFLKNISGLWLIQECKRSWENEGLELSYNEISQAAQAAEPDTFRLDPDDRRFLNPEDMPEAIRAYCRETGQPEPESPGQMARGIYESLARSYKRTIERLGELTGTDVETIHMVGGGIQAELLCQFTADETGLEVVAGPVEATALGNVLCQLMALGEIGGLKQGRELVRRSVDLKVYRPGRGTEAETQTGG